MARNTAGMSDNSVIFVITDNITELPDYRQGQMWIQWIQRGVS